MSRALLDIFSHFWDMNKGAEGVQEITTGGQSYLYTIARFS